MARDRSPADMRQAGQHYLEASGLLEKWQDSSLFAALLTHLGLWLRMLGQPAAAARRFELARENQETAAPGAPAMTSILYNLGVVAFDQRQFKVARQYFEQVWSRLQARGLNIRGDGAGEAFAGFQAFYLPALIRTYHELGDTTEALKTLESGRAQVLLDRLRERNLAEKLVPPNLWTSYQKAVRTQHEFARLVEEAAKRVDQARSFLNSASEEAERTQRRAALAMAETRLEDARAQETKARLETDTQMRAVRVGLERYLPSATDFEKASKRLPAGTVAALFSVGEQETMLFLIDGTSTPQMFRRETPERDLRVRVEKLVKLVSTGTGRGAKLLELPSTDTGRDAELPERVLKVSEDQLREMFAKIFPIEAQKVLANAKRIVISPDGPLWDLPFGALIVNASGPPRYLGLEKPLVFAQSLTLYIRSLEEPVRDRGPGKPVIVGNPLFDPAGRAELRAGRKPVPAKPGTKPGAKGPSRAAGELSLLSRDGSIPAPLLFAEPEASEISILHGAHHATGEKPTEAWFRERAPVAPWIHLATHGYFNPYRAMSSGVYLAVPEQPAKDGDTNNDGALQAWELMLPSFSLRAELVVLSACETGRGSQVPGEGLVGLTRALQVAGARSIVASQWVVNDASTKELMVRFHKELRQGIAKDEALRRAMLATSKVYPHPYHWSAFLLVGDPENRGLGVKSLAVTPGQKPRTVPNKK